MNKYLAGAISLMTLAVGIFLGAFGALYFQKKKGVVSEKEEKENIPKNVYKRIGDVVITPLDLNIVQSIPYLNQSKEDAEKSLMKLAVFYQEGKNLGLDKDSVVRRLRYWADKSVVVDAFYRRYILPKIKVDSSDVMEYIRQHKDEFSREVALLTVAFKDVKLADTLKKLLKDGSYAANLMLEEFARSGKISVQPSGYQNVGLGKFVLSEEEYGTLRKAKKEDVIGPFTVGPGAYVLAKVVDIRRVNIKDLDPQIKEVVYQYLLDQKRRAVEDSVFNVLLKKYQ